MSIRIVDDISLGEIKVTSSFVEGHLTPEYGISVVRGIDQIAAAITVQRGEIKAIGYGQDSRLSRIKGPIKFAQPVVVGDKMIITPSNLSADELTGNSTITVDGSTVTSIEGIEFEVVEAVGNINRHIQSEYAKTLIIESGAQTAIANFLHRRETSMTEEERAKGDFLLYVGIQGPIDWYEDVYPNQEIEIRLYKDPQNSLRGDVIVYSEDRRVAAILGNECLIGNRERTPQLIDRLVQRRRSRATRSE